MLILFNIKSIWMDLHCKFQILKTICGFYIVVVSSTLSVGIVDFKTFALLCDFVLCTVVWELGGHLSSSSVHKEILGSRPHLQSLELREKNYEQLNGVYYSKLLPLHDLSYTLHFPSAVISILLPKRMGFNYTSLMCASHDYVCFQLQAAGSQSETKSNDVHPTLLLSRLFRSERKVYLKFLCFLFLPLLLSPLPLL